MKWSQAYVFTLKEAPTDAEIPSHKLMVRAGLIKKVAPGIYTYGNLALRAIRKFENIIREELEKIGGVEVLMPMVQPRELWEETNRWNEMGPGLMKMQNRNDHWFCLGATHEEVITDYVRHDIKSYRDLPKSLYQIQTKYRDEIRPRFGLMRGREFIMKDAYTFDADEEGALKNYSLYYSAYRAIFDRLDLEYRTVNADAGNIGGSQTQEFQLLAAAGEDSLLVSDTTDFAANIEVCPAIDAEPFESKDAPLPLEKFATPKQRTIKDLAAFTQVEPQFLVKSLFFASDDGPVAVLLRGSDELNPIKLKNLLGMANPPLMLTDQEVKTLTGAYPGSCGPVGLKCPIYADQGPMGLKNWIVGANEDNFHLRNANPERDFKITEVADLRLAREGDRCPESNGRLKAFRGIEVGHVFYLGTKYSEKMSATYLDKAGKSLPLQMGCYGIGVSRTVQAAIEQSHDGDGIIWPKAISPFDVHICVLDPNDTKIMTLAEQIYTGLKTMNLSAFMDDRDERPGVKFKDADLLGFPLRLVIGAKGVEANALEIVIRKDKSQHKVPPQEVVTTLKSLWEKI